MRIAILGDVGQPVYHVGDEAMTHACIEELASRGLRDVLVLTRDEADSHRRFGTNAALTVPFPWPPQERSAYLDHVLRAAGGDRGALPPEDPAWAFISALGTCDALLIAGGGNMNSLYGWLLYERAAAALIAKKLGLTVVVAGQTFGPALHGRDRDVLSELVASASLVGAREPHSLGLGRGLPGDRTGAVTPCLDDASFFASRASVSEELAATVPAGPYIAATFSGGHGPVDRSDYIGAVAALLDEAATKTGGQVVFLPHMATPGMGDGDEAMHAELAAAMRCKPTLLPIQSAEDTAALTAGAAMVITSRYHPVIFALDAGIPVVAIACENYSYVRLNGALRNWGLGPLALPLPSLFDGTAGESIDESWTRRGEIAEHLAAARPRLHSGAVKWWDAIVETLGAPGETALVQGQGLGAEVRASEEPQNRFEFGRPWANRAAISGAIFLPMSAEAADLQVEREHLAGRLDQALLDRDAAQDNLNRWLSSRSYALTRTLVHAGKFIRGKARQ